MVLIFGVYMMTRVFVFLAFSWIFLTGVGGDLSVAFMRRPLFGVFDAILAFVINRLIDFCRVNGIFVSRVSRVLVTVADFLLVGVVVTSDNSRDSGVSAWLTSFEGVSDDSIIEPVSKNSNSSPEFDCACPKEQSICLWLDLLHLVQTKLFGHCLKRWLFPKHLTHCNGLSD